MGEQEKMLKKRSVNPSEGIGTQRMTLKEFNAWVQGYTIAIATAQKTLKSISISFTSESRFKPSEYRLLIRCITEIGENCSKLLESIEYSIYLPLAVVPFLLFPLTTLKKVETQVKLLKQILDKEFEATRTNYGVATEQQREVQYELEALSIICEEAMRQIQFLQHQSRFQESSLLQSCPNR